MRRHLGGTQSHRRRVEPALLQLDHATEHSVAQAAERVLTAAQDESTAPPPGDSDVHRELRRRRGELLVRLSGLIYASREDPPRALREAAEVARAVRTYLKERDEAAAGDESRDLGGGD